MESKLTSAELNDVLMAYLAGEFSEGFLREMLHDLMGLTGDEVRALWFDPADRGRKLADTWSSTRSSAGGVATPALPG